jgi:hypothetical protein
MSQKKEEVGRRMLKCSKVSKWPFLELRSRAGYISSVPERDVLFKRGINRVEIHHIALLISFLSI